MTFAPIPFERPGTLPYGAVDRRAAGAGFPPDDAASALVLVAGGGGGEMAGLIADECFDIAEVRSVPEPADAALDRLRAAGELGRLALVVVVDRGSPSASAPLEWLSWRQSVLVLHLGGSGRAALIREGRFVFRGFALGEMRNGVALTLAAGCVRRHREAAAGRQPLAMAA